MKQGETRPLVENSFSTFPYYRLYCTPDYWLITYKDQDFVRIMRNTSHRPGFALLCLEVFFFLLKGVRTDVRDKWAMWKADYEGNAKELGLECRAARGQVIEMEFKAATRRMQMKEGEK